MEENRLNSLAKISIKSAVMRSFKSICGSVNCSEKEETEVVWSRDKVKRTLQDSHTRNRTGGRRRGGQRKQWVDNIEEWTGLTFAKSQTIAQDHDTWKKIVYSIYPA